MLVFHVFVIIKKNGSKPKLNSSCTQIRQIGQKQDNPGALKCAIKL